jgi:hypothetical protein
MFSFNDFRRQQLNSAIHQTDSVLEGINYYFDIFRLDLLKAAQISYTITEGHDPVVVEALNWIIDYDNKRHTAIVESMIKKAKKEFYSDLLEEVDADADLEAEFSKLDPAAYPTLRKKIDFAIDRIVTKYQVDIMAKLNGVAPEAATSAGPTGGSGGVSFPGGGGVPTRPLGGTSPPSAPAVDPTLPAAPPTPAAPAGSEEGPPWGKQSPFFKKDTRPGLWPKVKNFGKQALRFAGQQARGAGKWLKQKWDNAKLDDHVVEQVLGLMDNIYEETDLNAASAFDPLKFALKRFIGQMVDPAGTSPPVGVPPVTPPVGKSPVVAPPASKLPVAPAAVDKPTVVAPPAGSDAVAGGIGGRTRSGPPDAMDPVSSPEAGRTLAPPARQAQAARADTVSGADTPPGETGLPAPGDAPGTETGLPVPGESPGTETGTPPGAAPETGLPAPGDAPGAETGPSGAVGAPEEVSAARKSPKAGGDIEEYLKSLPPDHAAFFDAIRHRENVPDDQLVGMQKYIGENLGRYRVGMLSTNDMKKDLYNKYLDHLNLPEVKDIPPAIRNRFVDAIEKASQDGNLYEFLQGQGDHVGKKAPASDLRNLYKQVGTLEGKSNFTNPPKDTNPRRDKKIAAALAEMLKNPEQLTALRQAAHFEEMRAKAPGNQVLPPSKVDKPVATAAAPEAAANPITTPAENPAVTPAENPAVTPAENPVTNPAENPITTPAENPVTTPAASPASQGPNSAYKDSIGRLHAEFLDILKRGDTQFNDADQFLPSKDQVRPFVNLPPDELDTKLGEIWYANYSRAHDIRSLDAKVEKAYAAGQNQGSVAQEPELPTQEPELPTQEPELPTQEPELPTQEPELPTQEPELPTQEPELPTQEPELPQKPKLTGLRSKLTGLGSHRKKQVQNPQERVYNPQEEHGRAQQRVNELPDVKKLVNDEDVTAYFDKAQEHGFKPDAELAIKHILMKKISANVLEKLGKPHPDPHFASIIAAKLLDGASMHDATIEYADDKRREEEPDVDTDLDKFAPPAAADADDDVNVNPNEDYLHDPESRQHRAGVSLPKRMGMESFQEWRARRVKVLH